MSKSNKPFFFVEHPTKSRVRLIDTDLDTGLGDLVIDIPAEIIADAEVRELLATHIAECLNRSIKTES